MADDGPKLIPNAVGEMLTPSVIGLDDEGKLLVGQTAREVTVRSAAAGDLVHRAVGLNGVGIEQVGAVPPAGAAKYQVVDPSRIVDVGARPFVHDGRKSSEIIVVSGDACDQDIAAAVAHEDVVAAAADEQVAAAAAR
ncbi:MAG TPA: hypothetical protein VGP68_01685 [Gemmataceae bacterium]|nr:hypothetical protein [Gemmataceae bacterium]